jgi:hypothetical protein
MILLLFLLVTFFASNCSQATQIRGVAVILPPRPVACDLEGPELQGVVTDRKTIEITIETAVKLRDYLDLLRECVLVRDGYIEKLENRIKAVE